MWLPQKVSWHLHVIIQLRFRLKRKYKISITWITQFVAYPCALFRDNCIPAECLSSLLSPSLRLSVCMRQVDNHAGFEVLTAMVMKGSICWDITQGSPFKVSSRVRGTCLHLQRQRISQAWNQRETRRQAGTHVPPKGWSTFNTLHGITSQKTELFMLRTTGKIFMKSGNEEFYKRLSSHPNFHLSVYQLILMTTGHELLQMFMHISQA
jgi:hypothetical protein